jgi:hypothetical protein
MAISSARRGTAPKKMNSSVKETRRALRKLILPVIPIDLFRRVACLAIRIIECKTASFKKGFPEKIPEPSGLKIGPTKRCPKVLNPVVGNSQESSQTRKYSMLKKKLCLDLEVIYSTTGYRKHF